MKVSYKILKNYLPYLDTALKVWEDLVMHTAEVEEIHSQKSYFENMVLWVITKIEQHPDADSLKVCQVAVWEENDIQIVCWGSNLEVGQKVAVAKIWASVVWHGQGEPVVMKKTAIRWVESLWMICAADEVWLADRFPAKDEKEIVDLKDFDFKAGKALCDVLEKNDEILEIDNKAINHRPDMFSYMWVLRELAVINNKSLDVDYASYDFSNTPKLNFTNQIPEFVRRYSLSKISWVGNITSSKEIQTIIEAAGHSVKGLLVDVSNYSLYFYGQPVHIFDAKKVSWDIQVRFAKVWEKILALDDKEYELGEKDIVIADSEKVLAIAWIIWGKSSAVSDETTEILVETAHFDQAILRMTWKRLWVRTDALNVFEKDILPEMCLRAQALVIRELQNAFQNLKVEAFADSYSQKQEKVIQDFDLNFYSNLVWYKFEEAETKNILENLWIKFLDSESSSEWQLKIEIPFWRKELTTKADIAEELARIIGYDNITTTVPRINIWAVIQSNTYKLKKDARAFFTDRGFFDVYNYSFVSNDLYEKLNMDINSCVELKNALTLDATHMKNSLIPNLMKWLEDNIKERKDIKLVELEKVFFKNWNEISEDYFLSGVMTSSKNLVYYDVQNIVTDFLQTIFTSNFYYDKVEVYPDFSHKWRTARVVVRGQDVWYVWEIHPVVSKRFGVEDRVWFFEINVWKLLAWIYSITKAKELSTFQENNFDLSFVVSKDVLWKDIKSTILNTDKKLINKVELFDIYEDEDKLPQARSLSFKVYIQSMTDTIKDDVKAQLIKDIIVKVEKKGGKLR